MKASKILLVPISTMAMIQECAPREKVNVTATRTALPENCPVTLYGVKEPTPTNYETLATIKFGEKGLSVSCTREEIEAEMRVQTFKAGGNAVMVLEETEPDLRSTRYRVTAELIQVEQS